MKQLPSAGLSALVPELKLNKVWGWEQGLGTASDVLPLSPGNGCLPPPHRVYTAQRLLIDGTRGTPPGGLRVKNCIWRKQCLLRRWKGHKPSKTVHLIYVIIMGMFISKDKAIHPKFQPPGFPHLTYREQPPLTGGSRRPDILHTESHSATPPAREPGAVRMLS